MTAETLLHVFPTFAVGGSQVRFAALANRFGRAFRHLVVAIDGRTDCRERLAPGLDVDFLQLPLRARDTFGNMRRFASVLRTVRPGRLITYNWGSIECAMANWRGRTSHVHIEDGFGPDEAGGQFRRRVLARRYVLRRSTVVLPSHTLFRMARDVWRLKRETLRYIPNGVDCRRFGEPGIEPFEWLGEGPVVGTVAALRPEKNLMRLLDAFRDVRDRMPCRLLIAGDGPERARLERYAASLGMSDDVRFAGHITQTEKIYAAMNVLVLSSDTEQMPVAVLEAMAAGLPVAATDVGDVLRMVAEENRAYVVPCNAPALAEAIAGLLTDPARASAIGAANRRAACESFPDDKMFEAYEAIYSGRDRLGAKGTYE